MTAAGSSLPSAQGALPTAMAGLGAAALKVPPVLLFLGFGLLAAPVCGDTHCLTSNVTVTPWARTGESYSVKMQLDGKDITASSCVKMLKESLKDMASETKKPLLEIGPRDKGTSYLFSLQCQMEADGSNHGSLTAGVGENVYLIRYLNEKDWSVVHPEGGELKTILSNDQYLNIKYKAILSEQCTTLENCEKTETKAPPTSPSDEPTLRVLARNCTDVSISASLNTTSHSSLSTQCSSRIEIPDYAIVAIVISTVIILILFCYCWKKHNTFSWDCCSDRIYRKLDHQRIC